MYCIKCGEKLDDSSKFCPKCGYGKDITTSKKRRKTNYNNISFIGIFFGMLAVLFSFILFFKDISYVGMYTKIWDRLVFAIDKSIFAIILSSITFIFSFLSNKSKYNKYIIFLFLLSVFLIISEFLVVIIY